MKHLSYFVALAAFLVFASCQKEDTPTESSVKEDPVFTATIANDETKTSLDLSTKKVSWAMSDEITITDSETPSNTVKYEVTAIDETTGKATFTKKSGESGTLGSGPYTATYGEAPSALQTYTATDGVQNVTKLPMSASSETTSLTFTVSCGLLKVTLTQTGISISSIAVSNGTSTYTLTCSEAVSIASGATFYITVPAGTYTSFKFTDSRNYISWRSPLSIAVTANHIKPVSSNFGPEYLENETLYGYGSKINGNWWAPVNCGYEPTSYQYGKLYQWGRKDGCGYNDVSTYKETEIQASVFSQTTLAAENAAKFYCGYYSWCSASYYNLWDSSISASCTESGHIPTKTDRDPCPGGWRIPTYGELNALIGNRDQGIYDGWDSTNKGYWFNGTASPSSGNGLFLPAAGCRNYSNGYAEDRGSHGNYWCSSACSDDIAWFLRFYSSYANTLFYNRAAGFSVRCVQQQ